jgi:hypothetical protein
MDTSPTLHSEQNSNTSLVMVKNEESVVKDDRKNSLPFLYNESNDN